MNTEAESRSRIPPLKSIGVAGFKSIRDKQTIAIAPLTIFATTKFEIFSDRSRMTSKFLMESLGSIPSIPPPMFSHGRPRVRILTIAQNSRRRRKRVIRLDIWNNYS